MKKPSSLRWLGFMVISFNLHSGVAFAMADRAGLSYTQGYEDGFIYTAQQTGKGCQGRLTQAAISRLDLSVKSQQIRTDGSDIGDGSNGYGDAQMQDYIAGKMQGMGDALAAPNDGSDACTNGD